MTKIQRFKKKQKLQRARRTYKKRSNLKKDTDALEKQIITLQGQLNVTKQKLENEKNKVVKPEPNPETGEIPLRTGLANAILSIKDNKKSRN